MDLQKATNDAIAFLQSYAPEGPWVLTAIDPDRKGISTITFRPSTLEELRSWLTQHNGGRNIYFHVNPVMQDMAKKAERTDIKSVDWLHVDIDPRAGEELEKERARALKLLQDFKPAPTVIVDSGGGFQGFWRLEEPIPVNGDLAAAEDAKRHNIQLELTFGADNCHNIDRIMRLPGTVNIPDAKKIKKGRVARLAEVVLFDKSRVYPVSLFPKAPEVQTGETGFSGGKVQISGNIPRLTDVNDLPEDVPDRIKVLIVQGVDPDEPGRYSSRSEALFAVCVALVRAGVDDDTIYAVITDPDFAISASVLESKRVEKYALRQIERAHEEKEHPFLRQLNEKHAVIGDMGGKCRVISEVFDPAMSRMRISRQSFDDFRNRYLHKQVDLGVDPTNGKPIRKKLGHWWLENSMHRHYETLCFAPGREVEGAYNLWKGFACEARPGDCDLFIEHMRSNICSGNEEHYEYLLNWMARAVQQPDTAGETAIVLRGRMGTGKSFFARVFGSLFGRHFLQVTDPKHLVGSFNSHLRDCVVLFGDEAFYAGDKKHESVLKTLITEPFIQFEAKGVDIETGPNYTHILLASNNTWVIPAGGDERRFFVLDVGDGKMQNGNYFQLLKTQLDNGGLEALLHLLLTRDIKEFDVRRVPKTEALREQKLLSMGPEEEWWYSKLQDGLLLSSHTTWDGSVEKDELFNDFYNYMQRLGAYRRASRTALSKFLDRVCPAGSPSVKQKWVTREVAGPEGWTTHKKERPYFYEFPDLQQCRDSWVGKFGEVTWQRITVDDSEPELSSSEPPF